MTGTYAPTLDDIETLARAALETIPDALRRHAHDVVIRVQDFPDAETCSDMELESEFDLLGLYSGVSLDHDEAVSIRQDVNMIFLYRRPLLDYWCETGEELAHLVRHVIIHEIGHHFGFSDDDMEALERLADERAGG
ncbi:MAG: metallopeptidase family protein [Alphaproteobacteria bacterium]|nr:metallopeptidase family protein [Alphaproteobacteria bacterium]